MMTRKNRPEFVMKKECGSILRGTLLGGIILLMTFPVMMSCTKVPIREATIVENDRGAVYLERVTRTDFHADHPVELDMAIVERVLSGIRVKARQSALTTLVFGHSEIVSAFLPQDVEFLAPAVSKGLKQASSHQALRFRVNHDSLGGSESTAGVLYREKDRLLVTLTQFRVSIDPATKIIVGRDVADPTGLSQRVVMFQPDVVLDTEDGRRSAVPEVGHLTTFVINYPRLARLPDSELGHAGPLQTTPIQPGATDVGNKPSGSNPNAAGSQDEIRGLRKQLADQESEIQRLRKLEEEYRDKTAK